MFTPWKCGDCGAHGKIRHERADNAARIARWTAERHRMKSPECHQRAQAAQTAVARLTPRDRHIIVTARIKRKLMADALRVQRNADRAAAVAAFCGRWSVEPDTLTRDERITAYGSAPGDTRKNWVAGKMTRKGYAFT